MPWTALFSPSLVSRSSQCMSGQGTDSQPQRWGRRSDWNLQGWNSKVQPHLKVSQVGDISNKKEQMGLIIIHLRCFWIIWPISCTSSIQDWNTNTYDGHGMGLHGQTIPVPGTMVQPLSMDNSQKLKRELGKVLSLWKCFFLLIWSSDPDL